MGNQRSKSVSTTAPVDHRSHHATAVDNSRKRFVASVSTFDTRYAQSNYDDAAPSTAKRARPEAYAPSAPALDEGDDIAPPSAEELLARGLVSPRAPNLREWLKYIVKTGNYRASLRDVLMPTIFQSMMVRKFAIVLALCNFIQVSVRRRTARMRPKSST